ncbi:uncharacterized protein LOC119628949 [Bombyx mori]|uniref:uncharacterized protein LOC119628949 n=1 Tax=Bombyx mori TaxID=7091 RepID=UPI002ED5C039
MKKTVILFIALIIHTSTVFFGEFQGPTPSVNKNFGKLMNDVVSDARQTIDCTVEAMKNEVDSGNLPYFYKPKCGNQNVKPLNNKNLDRKSRATFKDTENPRRHQKIVDGTIFKNTGKNKNKKINDIKNLLLNESRRLNNVDKFVKEDLDGISKDVRVQLEKIEHNDVKVALALQKPKVDSVKNASSEIKSKISAQSKNIKFANSASNSSDTSEIDDIVAKFQIETNNTLKEIEKQLQDWEKEESEQLQELKTLMESAKHPVTLKDLAQNITANSLSENSTLPFDTVNSSITPSTIVTPLPEIQSGKNLSSIDIPSKSSKGLQRTTIALASSTEHFTTTAIPTSNIISKLTTFKIATTTERTLTKADDSLNDYGGFFDFSPNDKHARDEAASSAEKIIKEGSFSKSLFNALSNKVEDAPSIF